MHSKIQVQKASENIVLSAKLTKLVLGFGPNLIRSIKQKFELLIHYLILD